MNHQFAIPSPEDRSFRPKLWRGAIKGTVSRFQGMSEEPKVENVWANRSPLSLMKAPLILSCRTRRISMLGRRSMVSPTQSISRRKFFATGAAALGLAPMAFLPARAGSHNEEILMGIIGCGGMGIRNMRNFLCIRGVASKPSASFLTKICYSPMACAFGTRSISWSV